ncbi:TPA: hypothetical protein ACG3ZP_003032 [Escherichia coli]
MNNHTHSASASWMQILSKKGTDEFASSFTPDVNLQTSVLNKEVVGPTAIGTFFTTTSTMYENFVFVKESIIDEKTYLEWDATHEGKPIAGLTVLTRDTSGLINNIKLFQSPFSVVREFSAALRVQLEDVLGQEFFN